MMVSEVTPIKIKDKLKDWKGKKKHAITQSHLCLMWIVPVSIAREVW